MTRRALRFSAIVLLLASCRRDRDSYIVLHNDVNCDVPRVFQLLVTIQNSGVSDQKLIPAVPSTELGFPSSIVLDLPSSRGGVVDVVVEAIDNKYQSIGQGTASGTIESGGRLDLQVQIAAAIVTGPVVEPASPGVDGGMGIDGSLNGSDGVRSDALVGNGVPFVRMAVGAMSSCSIRSDTSLWCWGNNTYGQLRLSGTTDRLTPIEVSGLSWSAVSCGQTHACGLRVDGTLSCWGNNGSGQLGVATTTTSNQQTEVANGPWQSVSAGSYQTCAIKTDATLWCWGDNTNGQLGTGSTVPSTDPLQVLGAGWSQVSTGYLHTCALKQDGTLWCWGLNADLQLGNPSVAFLMSPGQVAGSDWTQVTTGLYHTCALKQDGSLWCWGGNYKGQLGNAGVPAQDNSKTSDAVQVAGAWLSVSAGQSHTCGIMSDQSLWCWGDDTQGQLGDAKETPQSAPVAIGVPGQTWQAVAAGLAHTCGLAPGGTLWCWGSDANGQLGIGSLEWRQVPTLVTQ